MFTEFASVDDFISTVQSKHQSGSHCIEVALDHTLAYGVGLYQLWRREWRRQKTFEEAMRFALERKSASRLRLGQPLAPAEVHLADLFGIDHGSSVQSGANQVR